MTPDDSTPPGAHAVISSRVAAATIELEPIHRFITQSTYSRHFGDPNICDFTFGNPHELPLPGLLSAIRHWLEPKDKNWLAYKQSTEHARKIVAESLRAQLGLPFEPGDIFMTTGAFAALAGCMGACLDPGDEVVFPVPAWPFYGSMIRMLSGVPVKVPLRAGDFDLDLDAIAAAITPKTRILIVTTPHNPTGRIYTPQTLERLSELLTAMSQRHGRPIYLVSDEPYRRLCYPGAKFHSPAAFYPYTLISYSYAKVLLSPGARIGYLAVSPTLPERALVQKAVDLALLSGGWLYPNAVLQYAIEELENLSIDLEELWRKRDRMLAILREIGYEVPPAEGTFYLIPRSPIADDMAFCEKLTRHNVYVLPGSLCDLPGYFRISLTATMDMIEASEPGFRAAFAAARG